MTDNYVNGIMSTDLYSPPLFFIILHFTAISCAETPWELLDIGSAVVLASPLKDSKYNLPHSYNRFLETLMRVFAFFPFSDNIDRAAKSGVSYIVQPGGSVRDDIVIESANNYNMVMVCNGVRLFHH